MCLTPSSIIAKKGRLAQQPHHGAITEANDKDSARIELVQGGNLASKSLYVKRPANQLFDIP